MSNTKDKIKKFLDTNKIIYYKRDLEDICIFHLPYTFRKANYKVVFILRTNSFSTNIFEMGFSCVKGENPNLDAELLDMNAHLINGVLAVPNDTNEISFFAKFPIAGEELSNEEYENALSFCFAVFNELVGKDIINKNAYEYEKR